MLFNMRVKRLGPPENLVLEASSAERAQMVAEAYCGQNNLKLIKVTPFVTADESILLSDEEKKALAAIKAVVPVTAPGVQVGKGSGRA